MKKIYTGILLLLLITTWLSSPLFAVSENSDNQKVAKEAEPIVITPTPDKEDSAVEADTSGEVQEPMDAEDPEPEDEQINLSPLVEHGKKLFINQNTRTFLIFLNIIFFIIIILPLVPGVIEVNAPEDQEPLKINMEYSKDIHYFDNSFREMLKPKVDLENPGIQKVKFHENKPEEEINVLANDSEESVTFKNMNQTLVLTNSVHSSVKGNFKREIYSLGNLTVEGKSRIRAVVGDQNLYFKEGCVVQRWAGCPGEITVQKNTNLGIRAVCDRQMSLENRIIFKSLYGLPIVFGKGAWSSEPPKFDVRTKQELDEDTNDYKFKKKWTNIPPKSKIEKNVLAKKRGLVVGEKSIIKGNISAAGKIILKKEVIVEGDIFAEGDIIINKDCIVKGNIYGLKNVRLRNNVKTGTHPDKNYIIAKAELTVGSYSSILGNVRGDDEVTFDEHVNLEGNLFSESDIDLGPGNIIRQNIFTQSEIHFSEGVLVGRPGHIKSVIAKKGIDIDKDVTIHGFLSTDGTGVVS